MLEELLGIETVGTVSIIDFLIGLTEIVLISTVYKVIYDKFSNSVSNRNIFSFQFIPFSISIFLIVVTIKSSLVLSLGLVGALSIIRFRTAIKEPEQILSLLYLTGVSIAIAANKFILPIITTLVIMIFFIVRYRFSYNNLKADNMILIKFKKINLVDADNALSEINESLSINIELSNFKEAKDFSQIVLKMSEIDIKKIDEIKKILKNHNLAYEELTLY